MTVDSRQRVVIEGTDDRSGVALVEYSTQKNKQDASAWATYTGPFQIDAKSTISIRVIDNSGNVSAVTEVQRKDLR